MKKPAFSSGLLATSAALGGVYIDDKERIEFDPGIPTGHGGCTLYALTQLGDHGNNGLSAGFFSTTVLYFYMKTRWPFEASTPKFFRPCLTNIFGNNNDSLEYSLAPEFLTEDGKILPAEMKVVSYRENAVWRYDFSPSGLPVLKKPRAPSATLSQLVREKTEYFSRVVENFNPDTFPWSADQELRKMLVTLKNLLVDKPGGLVGAPPAEIPPPRRSIDKLP